MIKIRICGTFKSNYSFFYYNIIIIIMNQDNDENIQVPMLTVDVAPFDQSCGNL